MNKSQHLLPRNEGKIKSYESCVDVRAWSHDQWVRGNHLRDWMKCDMPVCILPIKTLTAALKNMTYKGRGKTVSRCRPGCKSKIVLDCVCASCDAIRECLKSDEKFEKYLTDEELETSHWPCDKCLDALKNIKLFWKVIVDKIYNLQFNKHVQDKTESTSRNESVRSIANMWRKEILQQTILIHNVNSYATFSEKKIELSSIHTSRTRYLHNDDIVSETRCASGDISFSVDKETQHSYTLFKGRRKSNKRVSVKVSTQDASCDNLEIENLELNACKKNIEFLQNQFNLQCDEIEYLKRDNESLKFELNNVFKRKFVPELHLALPQKPALLPDPFESFDAENNKKNSVTDIDSEMIITVKNCEDENYKHISLLQVLHKSNVQPKNKIEMNRTHCKKEDPVELLKKVRNNFSAIVKREVSIVHDKKKPTRSKESDIDATYHRVGSSLSDPLCSATSSFSKIST